MMRHAYIRWMAAMLVLGIAAGCQAGGRTEPPAPPPGPSRNADVFPNFQLTALDGETVALSKYRGKAVIIDLFATWCPPCRSTIPVLVELQRKYGDRLAVVGVAYDQGPVRKVRRFAEDMKINYDLYRGHEELARYVGLRGIPHMVLLDPQGAPVKSLIGYQPQQVYEAILEKILPPAKETRKGTHRGPA